MNLDKSMLNKTSFSQDMYVNLIILCLLAKLSNKIIDGKANSVVCQFSRQAV